MMTSKQQLSLHQIHLLEILLSVFTKQEIMNLKERELEVIFSYDEMYRALAYGYKPKEGN